MHRPLIFLCLLLVAALPAQSPVDVGDEGMETTALANEEAQAFTTGFEESNVGFLHIYVDPAADPLETYFMRGREMSDEALALLPGRFRRDAMDDNSTMYSALSIKGIDENLFLTRLDGPRRDQIDMFAVRDGKVVHLKTLAILDCAGNECTQMDSYITDVDLDTRFDLIQISRRRAEGRGATDERRTVYFMDTDTRRWKMTQELDVPWDGITFFGEGEPGER